MGEIGQDIIIVAVIVSSIPFTVFAVILILMYKSIRQIVKPDNLDNCLMNESERNKLLMKENEKLMDSFLNFAKSINKK